MQRAVADKHSFASVSDELDVIATCVNPTKSAAPMMQVAVPPPMLKAIDRALPLGSPWLFTVDVNDGAAAASTFGAGFCDYMHVAACNFVLRMHGGALSPVQEIVHALATTRLKSLHYDTWPAFAAVLDGVFGCGDASPVATYESAVLYAERQVGALSPFHCLASVLGGSLGGAAVASRVLVAGALTQDPILSSAWCVPAAPQILPWPESVLRIAALKKFTCIDSGMHPSLFVRVCEYVNFQLPPASLLYMGHRTLLPAEGSTLPALLELCGKGCGAVIVCVSSAMSWSEPRVTGEYVAILMRGKSVWVVDAKGPKYFEPSVSALAGERMFTCPSRVLFRFAAVALDPMTMAPASKTAACKRFLEGLDAALTPLISLVPTT